MNTTPQVRATLVQLRSFEAVARLGGVGKAAQALHLAQPTVSTQLRELSEAVGLRLLEPAGRGLRLTEEGGLLLQAGLAVIRRPIFYAWGNIGYTAALLVSLRLTEDVLHPDSPIFSSDSVRIQVYFLLLLVLTLAAGWQLTRLLRRLEP